MVPVPPPDPPPFYSDFQISIIFEFSEAVCEAVKAVSALA